MKKICMMLLAAVIVMPAFAEEKIRVAVFDPDCSGTTIDKGMKVAIREIISSTFVNSGNYDIVERSLLEKVMQEQEFSNSGVVNEKDATEIGKLAGANKVVLPVVTLTDRRYIMSVKMIDVKTASVERQKVKIIETGKLLDNIEPITLSLLNIRKINPQMAPEDPKRSKYSGIVDLGASFWEIPSIGVSTTHGCQIMPYLFVGAGLGFYYNYDTDGYFYTEEYSLPIYANIRGCIPNREIIPFVEVRAGYDVFQDGVYLAPAIGVTIKKFDFSVGYTMQRVKYIESFYYGRFTETFNANAITIRLGLKF